VFLRNEVRRTQPASFSLTPCGALPEAYFHVELPCDTKVSQQEHTAVNPVNHTIEHSPYENRDPLYSIVIIFVKMSYKCFYSYINDTDTIAILFPGHKKQYSTTQSDFKIR
jgi:hypothetical protein